MSRLLELGGGTNPHPRAEVDIDRHHGRGIGAGRDVLEVMWRFHEYYDEAYCSHLIEHIPKGEPLINVMNGVWEALKPGGSFTLLFPIIGWTTPMGTGQYVRGFYPWADPTHVNYLWLPESFQYFCEANPIGLQAEYGIKLWRPMNVEPWTEQSLTAMLNDYRMGPVAELGSSIWGIRGGWEGVVRLEKPRA